MQWLPGPVHENGILNAPMVSAQRFHGGGCRPVFGLWACLIHCRFPPSPEAVRWLLTVQCFVPITAAGQHWIRTSFPFNKPQSGLDLHTAILHVRAVPMGSLARLTGILVCTRYAQFVGIAFLSNPRYSGSVPWSLVIGSEEGIR